MRGFVGCSAPRGPIAALGRVFYGAGWWSQSHIPAEETQAFSRAGMLAPDGRCKFGDAAANGIVRSEGAGILVLKRLSDAENDGDTILGLIRGTAVVNGGRAGSSLTTPSISGERQAMLEALSDAGVSPSSIQYVEAHGTGSRAGDPVELQSIASVFGGEDRLNSPCRVGSIKSNIGHAESAAGVAGIIKTIQALRHKVFPATLHIEQPNPAIDWRTAGIMLERQGSPWEKLAHSPRRAAVNGLALTGTNAHVILEEAPESARTHTPERSLYILPISAASGEALRQRIQEMATLFKRLEGTADTTPIADICYTAAVRRGHLAERVAIVGGDTTRIVGQMERYLAGSDTPSMATGIAKPGGGKIAFIFPGQRSQWIGMGRELLKAEPVFRAILEACDREIRRQAGWSVLDQLEDASPEGPWARIDVIQPTLLAIELALAALWRSWGLVPSAVIGHSMGEVAAANVAGILSLEDTVAIICQRSSLMMRVAGAGAMVVVDLPQAEAEKAIERKRPCLRRCLE